MDMLYCLKAKIIFSNIWVLASLHTYFYKNFTEKDFVAIFNKDPKFPRNLRRQRQWQALPIMAIAKKKTKWFFFFINFERTLYHHTCVLFFESESRSLSHVRFFATQARILEWVAFPFSRGCSQHRDRTQVSSIAGRFFTSWAIL